MEAGADPSLVSAPTAASKAAVDVDKARMMLRMHSARRMQQMREEQKEAAAGSQKPPGANSSSRKTPTRSVGGSASPSSSQFHHQHTHHHLSASPSPTRGNVTEALRASNEKELEDRRRAYRQQQRAIAATAGLVAGSAGLVTAQDARLVSAFDKLQKKVNKLSSATQASAARVSETLRHQQQQHEYPIKKFFDPVASSAKEPSPRPTRQQSAGLVRSTQQSLAQASPTRPQVGGAAAVIPRSTTPAAIDHEMAVLEAKLRHLQRAKKQIKEEQEALTMRKAQAASVPSAGGGPRVSTILDAAIVHDAWGRRFQRVLTFTLDDIPDGPPVGPKRGTSSSSPISKGPAALTDAQRRASRSLVKPLESPSEFISNAAAHHRRQSSGDIGQEESPTSFTLPPAVAAVSMSYQPPSSSKRRNDYEPAVPMDENQNSNALQLSPCDAATPWMAVSAADTLHKRDSGAARPRQASADANQATEDAWQLSTEDEAEEHVVQSGGSSSLQFTWPPVGTTLVEVDDSGQHAGRQSQHETDSLHHRREEEENEFESLGQQDGHQDVAPNPGGTNELRDEQADETQYYYYYNDAGELIAMVPAAEYEQMLLEQQQQEGEEVTDDVTAAETLIDTVDESAEAVSAWAEQVESHLLESSDPLRSPTMQHLQNTPRRNKSPSVVFVDDVAQLPRQQRDPSGDDDNNSPLPAPSPRQFLTADANNAARNRAHPIRSAQSTGRTALEELVRIPSAAGEEMMHVARGGRPTTSSSSQHDVSGHVRVSSLLDDFGSDLGTESTDAPSPNQWGSSTMAAPAPSTAGVRGSTKRASILEPTDSFYDARNSDGQRVLGATKSQSRLIQAAASEGNPQLTDAEWLALEQAVIPKNLEPKLLKMTAGERRTLARRYSRALFQRSDE